jgi:hypothetical protein
MLRIAQLQRDSMAFQESQDTAREFKSAVQIVSRPPDQILSSSRLAFVGKVIVAPAGIAGRSMALEDGQ